MHICVYIVVCYVIPLHPFFDEGWDIGRGVGLEEVKSLAKEREAHGPRGEPAIALGIPPSVNAIDYPYDEDGCTANGSISPHIYRCKQVKCC